MRFLCTGHHKTRRPEMYQNMQPPRKLFVIFCQVRQFCLFRHQVGQFCFNLPSPAILFILPSPAISFISPSPSILLASNFVYFAKNSSSCEKTFYQKKQNIQLLTQFTSQKPLQPWNWLRNLPLYSLLYMEIISSENPHETEKAENVQNTVAWGPYCPLHSSVFFFLSCQ